LINWAFPALVGLLRSKVWLDPEERAISPSGAENIVKCPLRIGIISTGLIIQPTRERELLNQINFEILIQDESRKSRRKQGMGKDSGQPNTLLRFMLDAAGSQYYDTVAWVAQQLSSIFPQHLIGLYAGAAKIPRA